METGQERDGSKELLQVSVSQMLSGLSVSPN